MKISEFPAREFQVVVRLWDGIVRNADMPAVRQSVPVKTS